MNGAVSAALTALGGFAWFLGSVVRWIWEPISNPGEVYTRSENLGDLLALSAIFCAVLPFVALVRYLGAK